MPVYNTAITVLYSPIGLLHALYLQTLSPCSQVLATTNTRTHAPGRRATPCALISFGSLPRSRTTLLPPAVLHSFPIFTSRALAFYVARREALAYKGKNGVPSTSFSIEGTIRYLDQKDATILQEHRLASAPIGNKRVTQTKSLGESTNNAIGQFATCGYTATTTVGSRRLSTRFHTSTIGSSISVRVCLYLTDQQLPTNRLSNTRVFHILHKRIVFAPRRDQACVR